MVSRLPFHIKKVSELQTFFSSNDGAKLFYKGDVRLLNQKDLSRRIYGMTDSQVVNQLGEDLANSIPTGAIYSISFSLVNDVFSLLFSPNPASACREIPYTIVNDIVVDMGGDAVYLASHMANAIGCKKEETLPFANAFLGQSEGLKRGSSERYYEEIIEKPEGQSQSTRKRKSTKINSVPKKRVYNPDEEDFYFRFEHMSESAQKDVLIKMYKALSSNEGVLSEIFADRSFIMRNNCRQITISAQYKNENVNVLDFDLSTLANESPNRIVWALIVCLSIDGFMHPDDGIRCIDFSYSIREDLIRCLKAASNNMLDEELAQLSYSESVNNEINSLRKTIAEGEGIIKTPLKCHIEELLSSCGVDEIYALAKLLFNCGNKIRPLLVALLIKDNNRKLLYDVYMRLFSDGSQTSEDCFFYNLMRLDVGQDAIDEYKEKYEDVIYGFFLETVKPSVSSDESDYTVYLNKNLEHLSKLKDEYNKYIGVDYDTPKDIDSFEMSKIELFQAKTRRTNNSKKATTNGAWMNIRVSKESDINKSLLKLTEKGFECIDRPFRRK